MNRYKTTPNIYLLGQEGKRRSPEQSPHFFSCFTRLRLYQKRLCLGHIRSPVAKPPSKADPWSTLGPKRVHAGGGICHPEDRLGRGVQRPESGLGREFWSHGYPQCGLEGASNAHWQVPWITWSTHPVGEEVCLEKRQRESLNQSFPKCDICEPATAAAPGDLLQMKVLSPIPRPTESSARF